jgi:hypothetical protein
MDIRIVANPGDVIRIVWEKETEIEMETLKNKSDYDRNHGIKITAWIKKKKEEK